MKLVVEYELDNSDGFYNIPAEIVHEIILEALIANEPIHGIKNISVSIKEINVN